MHEVTLAKNIIAIVCQQAAENKLKHIHKIVLEIGRLCAVDSEALRFGFAIVSKKTICEEAVLEINFINAKASCDKCKKIMAIQQYGEACHYCNAYTLSLLQGEALRVKSMEGE